MNPFSKTKQKNFPQSEIKVDNINFVWKLMKSKSNDTHSCCHGESIVQFKAVDARKSFSKQKLSPWHHQVEHQAHISSTGYI